MAPRTRQVVAIAALLLLAGCSATAHSATSPSATTAGAVSSDEQAFFAEKAAEAAELYGVTDPPQVDIVAVVNQSEWPQVMVDCINEQGFAATLTEDRSGISVEGTVDQTEALNLAQYICYVQHPIKQEQQQLLTDAQKGLAYDYIVDTVVPCLAEHGRELTGIPTRETYIATYGTASVFTPYSQLMDVGANDPIWADCPINPPAEVLWGE